MKPQLSPISKSFRSRFHLLAAVAAGVSLLALWVAPVSAQQPGAPDWYTQSPEKLDAWAHDYVALLNAGEIEAANHSIPYDGLYELAIVPMVGDKRDDPEVLAYLKQFFQVFKSTLQPKGGDEYSYDFLRSGTEGGLVYVLLRTLPKGQPKAPEFNYLQVVVEKANDGDGYLVNDVFVVRGDVSISRVNQHLFVLLMPDEVFAKVETWSPAQKQLHAQREDILAVIKQAQADDPACLDSFLALDPPRPDDLVLLETVSNVVFEHGEDPEQIKNVMRAWIAARPQGICRLIWTALGLRRLGKSGSAEGFAESNKALDLLRGIDSYSGDAYLDVLSADHCMRLRQTEEGEKFARSAVAKEPNLYIAHHALNLILAKNKDHAALAASLRELAQIDAAFTRQYLDDQKMLSAFRTSEEGKALIAELTK